MVTWGRGIGPDKAKTFEAGIRQCVHSDEELLVIAKLLNFKPMVELLVITDARILAFSTTGMVLKVDIPHPDIVRGFVEAKAMSNVFTCEQRNGTVIRFKITSVEDVPLVQNALERVGAGCLRQMPPPPPPPYIPSSAESAVRPILENQETNVLTAQDFPQVQDIAHVAGGSKEEIASADTRSSLPIGLEEGQDQRRTSSQESDLFEQLRRLAQLRDEGILTDAEFNAKKAQILGI